MKRITLRRWATALACVALMTLLGACLYLPDFASQRKAGKYDPIDPLWAQEPNQAAIQPIAEKQTEPHTCGWHALRSLYRAYGLNPDGYRLRLRLGTDQPAMRADKDSTGTLHPDLYRVLAQDGFVARPVDLESATAQTDVYEHLQDRQLALVVVYRGTYHWVLLSGGGPGKVVMADSLTDEPAQMSLNGFWDDEQVLSVTLVEPGSADERASASRAHRAGLAEMGRLYQRR